MAYLTLTPPLQLFIAGDAGEKKSNTWVVQMQLVKVCDLLFGDKRSIKTHEGQFQGKHCKKIAQEKNKRCTEFFQGPKQASPTLSRIKVKRLGGSCSKWTKISLQMYYNHLGAKNMEAVKSRSPRVGRNRDQMSVMLCDHMAWISGEIKGCSEWQYTCEVLQLCRKVSLPPKGGAQPNLPVQSCHSMFSRAEQSSCSPRLWILVLHWVAV